MLNLDGFLPTTVQTFYQKLAVNLQLTKNLNFQRVFKNILSEVLLSTSSSRTILKSLVRIDACVSLNSKETLFRSDYRRRGENSGFRLPSYIYTTPPVNHVRYKKNQWKPKMKYAFQEQMQEMEDQKCDKRRRQILHNNKVTS